jgi:2-enoate reductase
MSRESFPNLLSPIKIGSIELKNRIALAPMNETMSDGQGNVTEQEIAYYGARAKGGTALITTGAVMGTKLASQFLWGRNLSCFHVGHCQGLSLLTDRIHYFGGLACIQLSLGFGRQGHSYDENLLCPAPTAGLPYEICMERYPLGYRQALKGSERGRVAAVGQMTREMTISEIHHEQKEFAGSAQLAMVAGFDMIEIHAPHGYLEHEFLSPLSNKRTDYYGGEWRNRKRMLLEVMEQVRYACPHAPVGVRISGEEHVQGGLTREEMIDLAQDLEARGAEFLSLSDGGGYEEANHLIPLKEIAEHWADTGADFKKALKIPVIISSQHDAVKAENDIAAGKFDISALGRQLFCDPEYANKLMTGRAHEIVRCKRDNMCILRAQAGIPPACILNPWLGREYANPEYQIGPRQKHEQLIPPGLRGMPALDRPWWKPEITVQEKYWREFRGPGFHPGSKKHAEGEE